MKTDSEIIKELGGAAKVAELLGFDKKGGTQRVHNWETRGIPLRVKVDYPDLFPIDSNNQEQRKKAA